MQSKAFEIQNTRNFWLFLHPVHTVQVQYLFMNFSKARESNKLIFENNNNV